MSVKFKRKLYNILNDLDNFKSKQELFSKCVSNKLDRSLNIYNKEIQKKCEYLLSRSNLKLLRNISKEYREEKEKNE